MTLLRERYRCGMITILIMLANIMLGVDDAILNVALPHIQGSLSASLDQVAWALTSYIVCAAIMMPLTGRPGQGNSDCDHDDNNCLGSREGAA